MPSFVAYGSLYQTTAAFSLAALNVGSGTGRMVLLGGPVGTAAGTITGSMSGGDAFSLAAGPTVSSANGSYNLLALAAAITAGGASQTGAFTSTGIDGPLKWLNAISVDGALSLRSAAVVSSGSFGDPAAVVSVQAGDLVVLTGNMLGVDRLFKAAASGAAAGTVKIDTGGNADFACYKVAASSGTLTIGGKFRDTGDTTDSTANWHGAVFVVAGAAPVPTLTGNINTDDSAPTGNLASLAPSSLTGNVQLADAAPTGTLGAQFSSVRTLPASRNPGNGGRLASIAGVALVVLSDDANLSRLAGTASLDMGSDGRLYYANGIPVPIGTSVLVVTRLPGASGAPGIERYVTIV